MLARAHLEVETPPPSLCNFYLNELILDKQVLGVGQGHTSNTLHTHLNTTNQWKIYIILWFMKITANSAYKIVIYDYKICAMRAYVHNHLL